MSGKLNPFFASQINALSEMEGFRTDLPLNQLDDKHIDLILYGSEDERRIKVTHRTRRGRRFQWNTKFEGVIKNLEKRLQQTESENVRTFIDRFMTSLPCNSCNGNKLKPEALAVTIDKQNIIQISNLPIEDSLNWINKLSDSSILSSREQTIASQILKEIQSRLKFLLNVGLDYLSLSRRASTLSGGESQRIRLATQIGSGLMGVLYVCDEPSIGLHPADDDRLITTLKNLRDVGLSLIHI